MSNKEKKAWMVLGVLILYIVFNYFMIRYFPSHSIYNYIIKPIICFSGIVFFYRKTKPKTDISIKQKPLLLIFTLLAAIAYFVTYFMLGFIDGFGRNPFNTTPMGIVLNLLTFIPYYILIEQLRSFFVHSFKKRNRTVAIVILVLVLTLSSFSPSALTSIFTNSFRANVEFLGSEVMAEISKNILLTNLALMGGAGATILVKLSFESIYFFFPVLPNLKWITVALLDNLFPIYTLALIRGALFPKENRDKRLPQEKNGISWIATYLFSIGIVWFAVGLFPIFPTVILTGSMEPEMYPGDVAVMHKVEQEEIEVGDIIQFWAENYFIIHRVIAIEDGKYRTKGDNNNTDDNTLVEFGQIKGKVIYKVPYIGKPVVFVRSRTDTSTKEEVVKDYELGKDDEN